MVGQRGRPAERSRGLVLVAVAPGVRHRARARSGGTGPGSHAGPHVGSRRGRSPQRSHGPASTDCGPRSVAWSHGSVASSAARSARRSRSCGQRQARPVPANSSCLPRLCGSDEIVTAITMTATSCAMPPMSGHEAEQHPDVALGGRLGRRRRTVGGDDLQVQHLLAERRAAGRLEVDVVAEPQQRGDGAAEPAVAARTRRPAEPEEAEHERRGDADDQDVEQAGAEAGAEARGGGQARHARRWWRCCGCGGPGSRSRWCLLGRSAVSGAAVPGVTTLGVEDAAAGVAPLSGVEAAASP